MEFVAILRTLRRERLLTVAGLALALAVAVFALRGRTQQSGLASMRVVVETPRSQLVTASPPGSATIQIRTELLGDLVATSSVEARIARTAGISADELSVLDPRLSQPVVVTPLPAAASALGQTLPYSLTVNVPDAQLPIVEFDARAPTTAGAGRLVSAAAIALGMTATEPGIDRRRDLIVRPVAPAHERVLTQSPRRLFAAMVALLTFVLWCLGIVLVRGDGTRRRVSIPARPA